MMKGFKYFALVLSLTLPIVAEAAFLMNNSATVKVENKVEPQGNICWSSDNGGMFYSSVEDAIDHANARANAGHGTQTIYLLPGTHTTIKRSCTIGDKVSLKMPYDKYSKVDKNDLPNVTWKTINETKKFGPIDSKEEVVNGTNNMRSSSITLDEGVTLTIGRGGELLIGGEYGQNGIAGYYTEMILSRNARIINNGLFKCFGYVKEKQYENLIQEDVDIRCIINDNASLLSPIAITDLPTTGTSLEACIKGKNQICPMNQFSFPSLQTCLKLKSNSNFVASTYLSKSVGGIDFEKKFDINVINSDSSVTNTLFKLSNNENANDSYNMVLNYVDTRPINSSTVDSKLHTRFTSPDLNKNIYTEVKLYHNVELGKIFLDLTDGYSVDTNEYFLPLSQMFRIEVMKNAHFKIPNAAKVKLLPGSVLKVNSGSKMDLFSSLIMYTNEDVHILNEFSDRKQYPTTFEDAKFILNGTLLLYGKSHIGGFIDTNDPDKTAKIDYSGTNYDVFFCKTFDGKTKKEVSHDTLAVTYDATTKKKEYCHFDAKNNDAYIETISGVINNKTVSYWNPASLLKTQKFTFKLFKPKADSTLGFLIERRVYLKPEEGKTPTVVYQTNYSNGSHVSVSRNMESAPTYTAYINHDEQVKIRVLRTNNFSQIGWKNQFANSKDFFDYRFQNFNSEQTLKITGADASVLKFSHNPNNATISGTGSIRLEIYESLSTVSDSFYFIDSIAPGSVKEPTKIYLPQNGFIKINLQHAHWNLDNEISKDHKSELLVGGIGPGSIPNSNLWAWVNNEAIIASNKEIEIKLYGGTSQI